MQIFTDDPSHVTPRWASSPERRDAALLVLPFLTLSVGAAGGAAYLGLRPGPLGGLAPFVTVVLALLALVLGGVSGFVYSAARARFLGRTEAALRDAIDEAQGELQDELKLRTLLNINRKQIEAYHLLTRRQANEAYRNSAIAMGAGLLLLVAGSAGVIFLPGVSTTQRVATATLTAIGSVVGGYVSNTFISTYKTALDQLNRYFQQPLEANARLAAERLIEQVDKPRQDRLRMKVIDELLRQRSVYPAETLVLAANGNGSGDPAHVAG
jgi:type II secretory pathway pseudopilin PulG